MKREQIEITFVEAKAKYAKALLDFYKQVGQETPYLTFGPEGLGVDQEQEQRYLKAIEGSLNNRVLLAILEGEIIGAITVGAPEGTKTEHIGELGICILRRYFGFGLSRLLMEDMLEWAIESPILRGLRLEVNVENIRALSLYKKYDFKEIGRLPEGQYVDGTFQETVLMYLPVKNSEQETASEENQEV